MNKVTGTNNIKLSVATLAKCARVFVAVFLLAAAAPSGRAAPAFKTLHSFNAPVDGAAPQAGLAWGTNGFFYGTTLGGPGSGGGSIFSLTPSGTLTTIYRSE